MTLPARFHRFALIAQPRTGTHFLRSILNQNPGVFCYGEVLFPWNFVWGFYSWLSVKQKEDNSLCFPTNWHRLLGGYLEELRNIMVESNKEHVGFDFKVQHLNNLFYGYDTLRQLGYAFIHLRRIHTPAVMFSLERASIVEKNNLSIHSSIQHDIPFLSVDTQQFKDRIWMFETEDNIASRYCRGEGCVNVFYEDLLSEEGLSLTSKKLSDLFQVKVDLLYKSKFVKQGPMNAKDRIQCDDEVLRIIEEYDARVEARQAEVEALT